MKLKIFLTILLMPAFLLAQGEGNEDRSYLADFAKVKAVLGYTAQKANILGSNTQYVANKVEYELAKIEIEDSKPLYVMALTTNKAEQLLINENSRDIYLTYETEPELLAQYREALTENKKDLAIKLIRKDIYSLFPLIETKEDVFIIQDSILEYLDLLVATKRVKEFYAIYETLNIRNLKPEYYTLAVHLTSQLAEAGMFEESLKVLTSLDIDVNDQDLTPYLLEILSFFRESGRIPEVRRYYERLKLVKDSKFSLEAEMWSLYCDIKLGNVLTAKVLLERFAGVDKKATEYSLYKFILGLIARDNKNYLNALEYFSEGIVYGKSVDDWMPELMYNTALSYFNAEKKNVSKQIYEEMKKFYPDNVFLAEAEKDLKDN